MTIVSLNVVVASFNLFPTIFKLDYNTAPDHVVKYVKLVTWCEVNVLYNRAKKILKIQFCKDLFLSKLDFSILQNIYQCLISMFIKI
jgi:hypothetical protein